MNGLLDIPTNTSGVYAIWNAVSGKCYIGSSKNVRKRLRAHVRMMERGTHPNPKMQTAWAKYGPSHFMCDVFEFVRPESLLEREQWWFDTMKPSLNILRFADSRKGHKQSLETIEKRISAIRGNPHSELWKQRISEAQKGRVFTEERRARMSTAAKNRSTVAYAKLSYVLCSPKGETFKVSNLSEFCRAHGLSRPHMTSVARKRRVAHKGWTCVYDETELVAMGK